jgi:hypothetical protein
MSHTFITTKSLEQSVGTMETSAPLHDTRRSCLLDALTGDPTYRRPHYT